MRPWTASGKRAARSEAHSLVELQDGRIWIAGGESYEATESGTRAALVRSASELWNEAWSPGPELAEPRAAHFAVRLASGRIVIGGGRDGEGERLASAELWEPDLSQVASVDALNEARERAQVVALRDGRALVLGGDFAVEGGATCEILADGTGEWTQVAPIPDISELFTATVLQDGRVLVCGGTLRGGWAVIEGVHYQPETVKGTRIFDPEHARWETASDMLDARRDHCSVLLHDGRLLVTGGFCKGQFLATAEIWDWRTERWEATGSMRLGRCQHTTCVLADGRILVAGGSSADGIHAETELWDPDTGVFTEGPTMLEPRIGHSATVLPDGRIFVTGGSGRGGTLTTSEVLRP